MTKFLNKWFRKIHRWVAVPTALLIPLAVFIKLTKGAIVTLPPQFELFQSLLMLALAITGSYLYLLPYIMKQKRKQRKSKHQPRITKGEQHA